MDGSSVGAIQALARSFHFQVVLSDQGRVLRRQTLSYYFRPTQAWRDSSGRNHILGIGRDKATGLNFPIQYLAVRAAPAGTAPHRDPTFARTSPHSL